MFSGCPDVTRYKDTNEAIDVMKIVNVNEFNLKPLQDAPESCVCLTASELTHLDTFSNIDLLNIILLIIYKMKLHNPSQTKTHTIPN